MDNPPLRRFCMLPGDRQNVTREQLIDDSDYYASFFFNELMRPYEWVTAPRGPPVGLAPSG